MTAQDPTDQNIDTIASATAAARRSTKRVQREARVLSQDLARLDAVLAESAGFTFVEETPDTTAQ